ncbi:ubiquinone biosynthesis O-methyltransferase, mitochondrial-like [Salvia hispanica]|uniref:ubiquinone biosynthesis O-methyltransferase, mitochondrial-like n=1 Tax=Salvia hispanica TaxID=49212 RepID=UPI0020090A1F|nr:ubiquinone biosynthesis O-methyltransferase, mitochondrial-like [Salvia hispanica]XP_047950536.1 ubiquinone biosynthesis O-methyltransferase, mitochondrial-like [Salvia hispanica]
MIPRQILARARLLARPAPRSSQPVNHYYPSLEFHHNLQTRRYSDAPLPIPAAANPITPVSPEPPLVPVSTPSPTASKSSLNEAELKKFAAISETWWDADGPFKPLHAMNPTRLAFIRSTLCRHFGKDPRSSRPFEGLKFVDVGCGGGILSEPLARMGASVTGVDAVEKNIRIAQLHADLDPTTSSIDYLCTTAEKLVEEQRKFDAVLALEVIEHVADPSDFCKSLSSLTENGGATVISTINRSMRAYATAIVMAEYVLRWLPAGTHDWSSFLTPEELVLILQRASVSVQEMAGFAYNPLTGRWFLSDDIGVNFIAYATKNRE